MAANENSEGSLERILQAKRAHLLSQFEEIKNRLSQAESEQDISALRQKWQTWNNAVNEHFPDPTASDAALDVHAVREKFNFGALADEARRSPGFQKNENAGVEPVLELKTDKAVPSERPLEKPGSDEKLGRAELPTKVGGGNLDKELKPPKRKRSKEKTHRGKPTDGEMDEEVESLINQASGLGASGSDLKRAGASRKNLEKLVDKLLRASNQTPTIETAEAPLTAVEPMPIQASAKEPGAEIDLPPPESHADSTQPVTDQGLKTAETPASPKSAAELAQTLKAGWERKEQWTGAVVNLGPRESSSQQRRSASVRRPSESPERPRSSMIKNGDVRPRRDGIEAQLKLKRFGNPVDKEAFSSAFEELRIYYQWLADYGKNDGIKGNGRQGLEWLARIKTEFEAPIVVKVAPPQAPREHRYSSKTTIYRTPDRGVQSRDIIGGKPPVSQKEARPEAVENFYESETYKTLARLRLSGMSIEEMQDAFVVTKKPLPTWLPEELKGLSRQGLKEAAVLFSKDIREDYARDPMYQKAVEITKSFVQELFAKVAEPGAQKELAKLKEKFGADFSVAKVDELAKDKKQLLSLAREIWQSFVYSSRESGMELLDERGRIRNFDFETDQIPQRFYNQFHRTMDIDARTCVQLLGLAGFSHGADFAPIKRGAAPQAGKFALDFGGKAGVFTEDETRGADNHPEGREYPGSAAKSFYEMLRTLGAFEQYEGIKKEPGHMRHKAIRMLVKYSIDSDQASLPVSTRGRLNDYNESYRTLRGLGYYIPGDKLFEFFQNYLESHPEELKKKAFDQVYADAVLQYRFDEPVPFPKFPEGQKAPTGYEYYGLPDPLYLKKVEGMKEGKPVAGKTPVFIWQQIKETIRQTQEALDKPIEELLAEGRVIKTRFGLFHMDLVQKRRDKLIGGHTAVQAYADKFHLTGNIGYNTDEQSFIVNTIDPNQDLSLDPRLRELQEKSGAVFVRGAMLIKSKDGQPLKVTLAEILDAIKTDDYTPQGWVKNFLEKQAAAAAQPTAPAGVEATPLAHRGGSPAREPEKAVLETPLSIPKADSPVPESSLAILEKGRIEFRGDEEVLRGIAKNNLTKFKEYLLDAYKIDDDTLRNAIGGRLHNLISGNFDTYVGYLKAGIEDKPNEQVMDLLKKNNLPYLKQFFLDKGLDEAALKQIFGQAYEDLRFHEIENQKDEK